MKKIHPQLLKQTMLAALVATLSGCAINPKEVAEFKAQKTQVAQEGLEQIKTQRVQESTLTVINSNYLGDAPIALPYASALPRNFFEVISIKSRDQAYGTVAQAARNITVVTGLPTNVNPDVFETGSAAQTVSVPNIGTPLAPQVSRAVTTNLPGAVVPINFNGTLLSYVKLVAASSGVEWEFKDGAIHFYKMVTKTFVLANLNPGDVSISDSMSKGGSASTGSQSSGGSGGGGGGGGSGSFASNSQVGFKGSYSVWTALKPALEAALSPGGKGNINEGTGTVTVTDTKAAVERIEKILAKEDAILGKQVAVEVRVVRVDSNNQSQAGFDLNMVYNSLTGNGIRQINTQFGDSVVGSTAGQLNFAVKNSVRGDSLLSVQALNKFGTIVSDSSTTLMTTNRIPAMSGAFNTSGYLASTTPGTAGANGGSGSAVGLNPGSTTTGSFLRVLPTIRENNSILLNMSIDLSDILGFGSASAGEGSTIQQITWANVAGTKTISNMLINQDESMIMAGISGDKMDTRAANSVSGASILGEKKKSVFIVIVTPRILKN